MVGSAESSAIVQIPEPSQPAPDTSNSIVSSPAAPLAAVIAARSDPAPVSLVFVTVKVAAEAAVAQSPRASASSRRMGGSPRLLNGQRDY